MERFLLELLKRFMAETPWFFKVIRTIGVVVSFVTFIPTLLTQIGLDIPDSWDSILMKVISVTAAMAAFIAQLTATTDAKKGDDIADK